MLPIVERELVKNRGWTTMDDAAEYYSIAQVTPGVIAVNMCTFIGYKKAGVAGGILATAAFLAPSVILVIILSLTLSNFARHPAVERCMMGIRVAVTALVLSTVITLVKNAIKDYRQAALCVLCLAFSFVWKANPAVLIIASGAAGFLFYSRGGGARTKPGDEK
jgi:chromate transporter